jgi:ubiquinone/menaquinone biosynthesis C-methylase UbiE
MFDHLFSVGALFPGARVADLGSGTGIFTELLLDRGLMVHAVEPNEDMRRMAESRLWERAGFSSVAGRAERTTLPDGSVDAVTAAQAFHWFDVEATRDEMRRILRPGGQVIMVWNNRERDLDEFHRAFSELMDEHARGKEEVDSLRKDVQDRFFPHGYHLAQFHHSKEYDLETLECLAVSASYMPKEGEDGYDGMMSGLCRVFSGHQVGGKVRLHYRTDCYHGRLEELDTQ